MNDFKAFRIDLQDKKIVAEFKQVSIDDLTEGEVIIKVNWSGINYKDALAGTGAGRILRQYPLNGGIDLAGDVVESADSRFSAGDSVLVCGCGLSETADGGFAQYARVCADCVVSIPQGLSQRDVMGIGTAGFTAGLAVDRMLQNGQTPELGPILVTGASGGVGSFAVNLFSQLGYEVIAFTGKTAQHDYLKSLGASDFINRHDFEMGTRPLEKASWGGAVDNVGGEVLAWLTRTVVPWGNIGSIGLVGGINLNTTVMPFILRGVSILGINSIEMPAATRNRVWQRMASDLKPVALDKIITREIEFEQLPDAFGDYLKGEALGRTVVKI